MTRNYKLLQEVLKECRLQRGFNIDKLVKARHQDNLEFLQWIKAVYDKRLAELPAGEYRAFDRRNLGVGPLPDWALSIGHNLKQRNKPPPGSNSNSKPPPPPSNQHLRKPSAASTPVADENAGPLVPQSDSHRKPTKAERTTSGELVISSGSPVRKTQPYTVNREEQLSSQILELSKSRDFLHNKVLVLEAYCKSCGPAVRSLDRAAVEHILFCDEFIEPKFESKFEPKFESKFESKFSINNPPLSDRAAIF